MTSTKEDTRVQKESDDNDNIVYISNSSPNDLRQNMKKNDARLSKESPVERKIRNPLKVLKRLTTGMTLVWYILGMVYTTIMIIYFIISIIFIVSHDCVILSSLLF